MQRSDNTADRAGKKGRLTDNSHIRNEDRLGEVAYTGIDNCESQACGCSPSHSCGLGAFVEAMACLGNHAATKSRLVDTTTASTLSLIAATNVMIKY